MKKGEAAAMSLQEELEKNLMENQEKYYRFIYGYVRNQEDALDIMQEGAYKIIKNQRKLRKKQQMDSWMYSIFRNTALDFLKQKKREFPMDNETLSEMSGTYEMEESRENFYDLLGCLNEEEYTVVTLRYAEEKKLDEIAEILGEKVSTVKSRLYRALDRLRKNMA
ncbi:MAG: RNA polymerase sigma factor [bacterium]|nr:RNA polymerase sigma factor [bacterium]